MLNKKGYWCRALAGKTAGGVVFALIFLFLFVSRQKENKRKINIINRHDENLFGLPD